MDQKLEKIEQKIREIEVSRIPTNFQEKFRFHFELFQLHQQLIFLNKFEEFFLLYFSQTFLEYIQAILVARDNQFQA